MKSLFVVVVVAFFALFFSANTNITRAEEVSVVPSETQPSPELPFKGAYTPFTSFDLMFPKNVFTGIFLRIIPVSVNFFDSNGVPCGGGLKVEDFLEAIIVVADPSPGNSEVLEKRIIAYKKIKNAKEGKVNLFLNYYCSSGAKFTVLAVPKGARNPDIMVAINILALKYSQSADSKIHKAEGLPFNVNVGTKQPAGTYGEAPNVKVSWSRPSSSGRALIVEVFGKDVVFEKIFIKSDTESAILRIVPDSEEKDYLCESDGSFIISSDFNGGIKIGQGERTFVYCKDDKDLLTPISAIRRDMIFNDVISGRLLVTSK